ncbi:hypothetical protein JTE90_011322 [Oedothorax gibbosus]|uniref:Noggin n=1 Tax=Oedothorax gibbosus TaxID=931172 RepID=A0AAV6VMX9_9ARAC|nr:hypothetical protein JTE90_011322 [Oedothorax gibbosus]
MFEGVCVVRRRSSVSVGVVKRIRGLFFLICYCLGRSVVAPSCVDRWGPESRLRVGPTLHESLILIFSLFLHQSIPPSSHRILGGENFLQSGQPLARKMDHPSPSFCIFILLLLLPYNEGRRPDPSSVLPVLDLLEPRGDLYDPRPEDTDEARLRSILGRSFDPKVMSIRQPTAFLTHPNGTVQLGLRKTWSGGMVPLGVPPKFIKRLKLQGVRMGDGKRIDIKMGNKMRRRFRDLLWLQSHCPLLQKWKDLGPRFWPRWFLENSCALRATCSFPRGMVCRPHKSLNKILLRWHCQNWESKKNCNWLRVQYPLVTECQCGC